MRIFALDHNRIALAAEALAPAVRAEAYGGLIAVLRGGLYLAAHLAFATALPLHFLAYQRATREVCWRSPAPLAQRLLLCEDIAGQGDTLADCVDFLESCGHQVDVIVVCQDEASVRAPRWSLFNAGEPGARFLLPWERHQLNPETVRAAANTPDHALRKTAWDLDGVFVDDVESHHYRSDLATVLDHRDTLPLASYAPQPAAHEIIITGRPEGDAERTLAWCRRVGLGLRIVFRNDQRAWPTAGEVAEFKGRRALACGCTDYVESDASQATLMAQAFPELRVTWWNEGRPILVQAALLGAPTPLKP